MLDINFYCDWLYFEFFFLKMIHEKWSALTNHQLLIRHFNQKCWMESVFYWFLTCDFDLTFASQLKSNWLTKNPNMFALNYSLINSKWHYLGVSRQKYNWYRYTTRIRVTIGTDRRKNRQNIARNERQKMHQFKNFDIKGCIVLI